MENRKIQGEENRNHCKDEKRFVVDGRKKPLCDQDKDQKRKKGFLVKPPDIPSECDSHTDDDRCQKEEHFLGIEIKRADIHKKS